MTIQVYYCKLNTRFMIINLQHKKERLSYVSMRDYKALCVAVLFCTIKGRAARRWLVCLPLAQNLRTVLLHAQYCLLPHCYEVLPFTRHITSHG